MAEVRQSAELAFELLRRGVLSTVQHFQGYWVLGALVDRGENHTHAAVTQHALQAVVREHDRRPVALAEHARPELLAHHGGAQTDRIARGVGA
jgi:hypothetical protein